MSDNVERILAAIAALSEGERARLFERLAGEVGASPAAKTAILLHFAADELEGPADYTIIFDGGSRGNPGPGYGSYALVREYNGKQSKSAIGFWPPGDEQRGGV